MYSILTELPTELQLQIVFFLRQKDLLRLSLVSHHFYQLAVRVLYRRVYLNDSQIELSPVYELAPTWSFFQLHSIHKVGDRAERANANLKKLIRSLKENVHLCELVNEIRLNWDLDIDLQTSFVMVLTKHSSSLRLIDNVTNPLINGAIDGCLYEENLLSLDLPPPKALPSLDIPKTYIPNLRRFLRRRLSHTIKSITLFMDPTLMFNAVVPLQDKLELDSLKLHCRSDTYPIALYNKTKWKRHEMRDIFDVKSLKTLTIISWYDHPCPDKVYKFDEWAAFTNLEDITLIAVTYNDKKIANMIRSCKKLRRLKLDFTVTLKWIPRDGEVYNSIFQHKDHMEFLDIKVQQSHKIMNLDVRDFKIVLRSPCQCHLCQEKVIKGIFQSKILTQEEDYIARDASFDTFERANFYELLQSSNIFPYSKAVDHYPSVRTGPEDPASLIFRFNEINEDRPGFVPLDMEDFYALHHCFIHTFKTDIEPFMRQFPNLKFLVYNEVSFVMKQVEEKRYAMPLFYSDGFEPNFFVRVGKTNERVFDRTLYLN